MSEQLGPVNFPQHEAHPFLGMDMAQAKDFSDYTARLIDEEVEKLVKRSEQITDKLLEEHREELVRLAEGILEHETLEAEDIKKIMVLEK